MSAVQIQLVSPDSSLIPKTVGGKRKRMEENSTGEAGNIARRPAMGQVILWLKSLHQQCLAREALIKRMETDMKGLTARIENVSESLKEKTDQIKIEREGFEKEKKEMEATIKKLQSELAFKEIARTKFLKELTAKAKDNAKIIIEKMDQMKIEKEKLEKEKKEMEATIKRLQNELKFKSEIKSDTRGNIYNGSKLEHSHTPSSTVVGAATTASATTGGAIERLGRCESRFIKHDGEIDILKRQVSELKRLMYIRPKDGGTPPVWQSLYV